MKAFFNNIAVLLVEKVSLLKRELAVLTLKNIT
jgi:hypothetical protein